MENYTITIKVRSKGKATLKGSSKSPLPGKNDLTKHQVSEIIKQLKPGE